MFIKLSSKNASNPARFKNSFLDQLKIAPNSKVRFIGGSISRISDGLSLVFTSNIPFIVKADAYNYHEKTIPAGNYTLVSLAAFLNNEFNDEWSAYISMVFEVEPNTPTKISTGVQMALDNLVGIGTVDEFLHGDKYWKETGSISTIPNWSNPTLTFRGNQITGLNMENNQKNCWSPWWRTTYPSVLTNKAFCSMVVPMVDNEMSSDEWSMTGKITTGTETNVVKVCVNYGHATANDIEMLTAPVSDGDPNGEDIYYQLQMSNNGYLKYSSRDKTTGELVSMGNSYWNPGARFTSHALLSSTVNPPEGSLYSRNVYHQDVDGLVGWYDCKIISPVLSYPYFPPADAPDKFLYNQDTLNDRISLWEGGNWYNSHGNRFSLGWENLSKQLSYSSSIVGSTIDRQTSANKEINERVLLRRFSAAAAPSANSDANNTIEIDNPINLNADTLLSLRFNLLDDSAQNAGLIRTLMGGSDNTSIILINLNAAGGTADFVLTRNDGINEGVTLRNPGDNSRPNINFNTEYLFFYVNYSFVNQYEVKLWDLDANGGTGKLFTSGLLTYTVAGTDKYLTPLKRIGGANIGPSGAVDSCDNYLGAYVNDFRVYQKNTGNSAGGGYVAMFNDIMSAIETYWVSGTAGNRVYTDAYLNIPTRTAVGNETTLKTPEYSHFGSINPSVKVCSPTIVQDRQISQWETTFPLIKNIYFQSHQSVKDVEKYNGTIITEPMTSNIGSGLVGLNASGFLNFVGVDDYNTTNDFELGPKKTNAVEESLVLTHMNNEHATLEDKVYNVEIKNLPHLSYNGVNGNIDKTIYQIHSNPSGDKISNNDLISNVLAPTPLLIDLNNAGEICLNELEVHITDEEGKVETDLRQETVVNIEIL